MMSKEQFFKLWDDLHSGIPKSDIIAAWDDVDADIMAYINSPEFINGSNFNQEQINEVIEGLK